MSTYDKQFKQMERAGFKRVATVKVEVEFWLNKDGSTITGFISTLDLANRPAFAVRDDLAAMVTSAELYMGAAAMIFTGEIVPAIGGGEMIDVEPSSGTALDAAKIKTAADAHKLRNRMDETVGRLKKESQS